MYLAPKRFHRSSLHVIRKRFRRRGERTRFFFERDRGVNYAHTRAYVRGNAANVIFRLVRPPREKTKLVYRDAFISKTFSNSPTRSTRARVRRDGRGGEGTRLFPNCPSLSHTPKILRARACSDSNNGCPRSLYLQFISTIVCLGMPNSSQTVSFRLRWKYIYIYIFLFPRPRSPFRNRRLREA